MAITMDDVRDSSWRQTVERFVTANSDWLDEGHLPQLKTLYAIATTLDGGTRATPALLSQFTLTQRTLAAKAPDAGEKPDGAGQVEGSVPLDFDGLLDS